MHIKTQRTPKGQNDLDSKMEASCIDFKYITQAQQSKQYGTGIETGRQTYGPEQSPQIRHTGTIIFTKVLRLHNGKEVSSTVIQNGKKILKRGFIFFYY